MASQQSTFTSQPQSLEEKLTPKHLAYLVETLYEVADKCQALGLQLGVDKSTLRKIDKEHKEHDDQLCEILDTCLKQASLTMQDIVQALGRKSVGEKELASTIAHSLPHQSSVTPSQVVTGAKTTATPPSTHHSIFQPTPQANIATRKPQPHPPSRGDCDISHIQVGNMCSKPQQLPQHSSFNLPPNPPTFTPSQPQAEAAQPPSSSQPSSSQLMSVPVTSQAMPGPSPQLSQDVAAPHPLQVGGQQALQGQPPQQHVPSHQLQTVAQSHGTGSDNGPPQAKRVRYESPMAQYIEYVKTLYRRTVVEKKLNTIKWPPTPSKVYINLVCVDQTTNIPTKEADECTRAMVCDGNVDVILKKKRPIMFSDITRDLPDTALEKVVLVEGAPGVGKSTFAWEFCRRWERGEIAEQYHLVLLLRLRDERISKAQSLADLIFHSSDHIHQGVVQELEYTFGDNTLIILEGFDELPSTCRTQSSVFLQLIDGQLLPLATVLVTSRPWATQDIHRKCGDHIFKHIEILGFTSDQIEEYVESVFVKGPAKDKAKKNTEEVMSYIKTYPQIKACMYIPLNSVIVVSVYKESKAGKCILPKTLTELYYTLIQILLLRYLYGHSEYGKRKWKIQSLEDLPKEVHSKLLAISALAYSGICTDQEGSVQLIYTNEHVPPDFETLGLMQSVPQLYVTQGEDMSHNFLHLTVQEFLAALHISNMSPEQQLEHFRRQGKEGRWRVVLRFLAGITKLTNLSADLMKSLLLEQPNEHQRDRYCITADVVLSSQHGNWMFETQRDDIAPVVLEKETVEYMGHKGLTPLDYYSLGYCIHHSHSHWVLTIQDNRIEEEDVRMLVAGVNTRCDSSSRVMGLRGERNKEYDGGYWPLSISTEALNVLFIEMKNVIHLQELHLKLPAECSSITWPDLSGLRVLHLAISGKWNWRLDTLLPHLSLESLTIEVTHDEDSLGLDNLAAIKEIFLCSNCPKYVDITGHSFPATAEVAVGQHVCEKKSVEYITCQLDWYSVGCVIAHSNFQWVLEVKEYLVREAIGEEDVRMLVAGVNTRCDTSARVVGLRGVQEDEDDNGCLSISTEALNVLFIEMKNVIHLQELHLELPAECSSITWPDLSGLRVLHLAISGERNWRLDTLLPHLSLEYLTFDSTRDGCTVVFEDCVAIGMLLSSSNCLKGLEFQNYESFLDIVPQDMEAITKAMSENEHLPLRSVVMECRCTFSDTAAHSLAVFIRKSTTLHHLRIMGCTFSSAHGLLELAQAIHHSSSLLERTLEMLTYAVDGDNEATDCAKLLHHPHVVDWLPWVDVHMSHITDKGAEAIATALHHNSPLGQLDLSNNSISNAGSTALAQALLHNSTLGQLDLSNNSISDAGSTALAQALHHNSTLWRLDLSNNSISNAGSTALAEALHHNSTLRRLDLSGNDVMSAEGTCQLVQALTVNTTVYHLALPRRCEEYTTQCPQYSQVKHRIRFL